MASSSRLVNQDDLVLFVGQLRRRPFPITEQDLTDALDVVDEARREVSEAVCSRCGAGLDAEDADRSECADCRANETRWNPGDISEINARRAALIEIEMRRPLYQNELDELDALERLAVGSTSNPRKYHHIDVRDPKKWNIVATISLGKKDRAGQPVKGIKARIGRPRTGTGSRSLGGTKIVTLLFDPRLWTMAEAKRQAARICARQGKGCRTRETLKATIEPEHRLAKRRR
jgi:hypothetical protein